MIKPRLISYGLIFLTLLLVGGLELGTPFLTVLFSYFALSKMHFGRSKWIAAAVFVVVVLAMMYGFGFFFRRALIALPKIVSTSLPLIIDYAQSKGLELPFDDVGSLKELLVNNLKHQLRSIGSFATLATKEFALLVIGFVVATSLFLNGRIDLSRDRYPIRNNLYSLACDEIVDRFGIFYASFARVMGAQLLISLINTALTAGFIFSIRLPHAGLVVMFTFLCGLLPLIGNIISNALIVGIAFTISPHLAISALVFLIVLHKLEYFLNSKIIGDRIKNPVWLTLLALVLGERLMGIPGMILAPVVLNYLKVEASQIEVRDHKDEPESALP